MIDTQPRLVDLSRRLRDAPWLAIDTEADSLHSYPDRLCLLQISHPGEDALVDTLARLDLAPLLEVLARHELILHGGDYDLRLLRRDLGFIPTTVFDTMSAARLVGCQEFGLNNLLRTLLGVTLDKGSQKANWARRPLTERMATYARNDTHYLKPLADRLRADLHARERVEWHRQCCAQLVSECARLNLPDPERVWRLGGSQRLDRRGLGVLRELWLWREAEALLWHRPPFFILSHDLLVALAEHAANNEPCDPLLPPHLHYPRRAGLKAAIKRGLELPAERLPQRLKHTSVRLTDGARRKLDQLRKHRDRRARDLELDPALIASRPDLVQVAVNPDHVQCLMPWQRDLLLH